MNHVKPSGHPRSAHSVIRTIQEAAFSYYVPQLRNQFSSFYLYCTNLKKQKHCLKACCKSNPIQSNRTDRFRLNSIHFKLTVGIRKCSEVQFITQIGQEVSYPTKQSRLHQVTDLEYSLLLDRHVATVNCPSL